jgi:PAS domain S-box-containing protein
MKTKLQEFVIDQSRVLLNEAESLAKMGSWKWTESTNKLIGSEGLYRILDKEFHETISWETFLESVLPEDVSLVNHCLHQVKTNKSGSTIDYRISKEGRIRYLSLTVKPHTHLDIDILGTVADITERKEYEKQLEQFNLSQSKIIKELDEKETKYRALFERSIDPIFLANHKLALTDVNKSFLDFFEYEASDSHSIIIDNIFAHPEEYTHFKNTLKEAGQIKDFEVSLITKTGDIKVCLLNCVFIPHQDPDYSCYQGIVRDLTIRKKAENEMLNAERLSLTGKIARTIAHEVRNPLTNLSLALDQLRDEIPSENELAKLYGDIIERNANRIEQLMGEMLNSSKPRKLRLALAPVNEIIDEAVTHAKDRLNLNRIELIINYQDSLPQLLVDKEKIKIALLNLFINAIEAMTPGKGVLSVTVSANSEGLTISVSDNGKGIPASDLDKLFDPFFTSKQSGMGLGLASTKNIIISHGANIQVKSEVNKGTTFSINFKTRDQHL